MAEVYDGPPGTSPAHTPNGIPVLDLESQLKQPTAPKGEETQDDTTIFGHANAKMRENLAKKGIKLPATKRTQQIPATAKSISYVGVCCQILLAAITFAILLWVYIASDGKYCKKPLRDWVLVTLITLPIFLVFGLILMSMRASEALVPFAMCLSCILMLGYLFQGAWLIIGSIWVYSIEKQDCYADLYNVVFGYITACWVLAALSCLFCCCTMCLAGAAGTAT